MNHEEDSRRDSEKSGALFRIFNTIGQLRMIIHNYHIIIVIYIIISINI